MKKKQKPSQPGYGRILDAWVPPATAGEPIGCVATSFTFSPALFEEECLGRFVALETSAAEDGPAYLVEREEKLSQLSCAAALVDQHHARGLRSLRWDLLPARISRGILHAKVSLLLWSSHARVIVGSANLTEDGYRRNQEVFGVLDYYDGGEAPLEVLSEIREFLRGAVTFATPDNAMQGAAVERWQEFLERVGQATRRWGSAEAPRGFSKTRVMAVLTGPKRPSLLATVGERWPDGSPPDQAYVISPFFDPPAAGNEPAKQLWSLLKQRGAAGVEFDVTAEEVPGENALLLHAPQSLMTAQPAQRPQVETVFKRLRLEESRPLHAKCLWLENERIALHLVGSSNFTSAGLGVGSIQNLEANLAFCVAHDAGDARKSLSQAWPPGDEIPDGVELRWQPREDEGEDSPAGELLILPSAFGSASFDSDAGKHFVALGIAGNPPAGWVLFPEEDEQPVVTAAQWEAQNRPPVLRLDWTNQRAPSGFRVAWNESGGMAWWPVNVVHGTALPPPDELKNLPLEVLINILTSAKPLHLALAAWLRRKAAGGANAHPQALDPHKRVDTSAFLLQRTRRVSWALSALRQRLEKPVYSLESLTWRLRGPVGAVALAQAIGGEARSEAERCFLLTELCLDLARVRPQVGPGSLSKQRVQAALQELIREIHGGLSPAALSADPGLSGYVTAAFAEVLT
jgi:hypothetical protein